MAEPMVEPILGYNVIAKLVLLSCFPSTQPSKMNKFASLIQDQEEKGDFLGKVNSFGIVEVPKGHQILVRC